MENSEARKRHNERIAADWRDSTMFRDNSAAKAAAAERTQLYYDSLEGMAEREREANPPIVLCGGCDDCGPPQPGEKEWLAERPGVAHDSLEGQAERISDAIFDGKYAPPPKLPETTADYIRRLCKEKAAAEQERDDWKNAAIEVARMYGDLIGQHTKAAVERVRAAIEAHGE